MATLCNFTKQPMSELFDKHGIFFAFSQKQVDENKKPGIIYNNLGSGIFCPKDNVEQFISDLENVVATSVETHKSKESKEKIILDQLRNHEAFYTGDISSTFEALEAYNYTKKDVITVYRKYMATEEI